MLILGSCLALNLNYSGCCLFEMTPPCGYFNECYCDVKCHELNDCCSDIADIGCHPPSSSSTIVSPTPTAILGKDVSKLTGYILVSLIIRCT